MQLENWFAVVFLVGLFFGGVLLYWWARSFYKPKIEVLDQVVGELLEKEAWYRVIEAHGTIHSLKFGKPYDCERCNRPSIQVAVYDLTGGQKWCIKCIMKKNAVNNLMRLAAD